MSNTNIPECELNALRTALFELMRKLKCDQNEIARMTECSSTAVSRWFSKKHGISKKNAERIRWVCQMHNVGVNVIGNENKVSQSFDLSAFRSRLTKRILQIPEIPPSAMVEIIRAVNETD